MNVHADVLIPHVSPRFFLGRTPDGNICRVASDVPQSITEKLTFLAKDEPVSDAPNGLPVYADVYAEILAEASAVERKWIGPAYYFPRTMFAHSRKVVQITNENISLLQPNHKAWIRDVGRRDPVCVLLNGSEVLSICYSPAMSDLAHEAGVETVSTHRGKGYAVFVVASWASAVREIGIEPLYSTSSDNLASQSIASKLGLVPIGMDFHLT